MKRAASAVCCMVLVGGLVASVSTAQSQSNLQITYYVDSLAAYDGMSAIFRVEPDNANMIINLDQVVLLEPSLGAGEWDNVDVLSATPDGERLYFINDGNTVSVDNGKLGYYDLLTDTLGVVGNVTYNDMGPTVANTNTTDQGAISSDGTMYITRTDTETLYRLDLTTAVATAVGLLRNYSGSGTPIDLLGADIAFDPTGRLYVWANNGNSAVPRGLYAAASTTLPASGDVPMYYQGENGVVYSGLAFLDAGWGNLIGSSKSDVFVEINRDFGNIVRQYEPRLVGQTATFDTGNGDMTTGLLGGLPSFCTLTIGYWKNHAWPRSATINGEEITESEGRGNRNGYLWQARGNNFSMLYAQLIGAKLNCPFCVDVWTEAEAFLAANGIGEGNFNAPFPNKQVRREASRLSDELDWFNNAYHCTDK